jgi:hypothetical protein
MEWLDINQQMRQRALELALDAERYLTDVDEQMTIIQRARMYYEWIESGGFPKGQEVQVRDDIIQE